MRTLRALGVPGRLLGLVMVELLALALVAGLIGVGLGYLLAAALLPDVAATLGGLYGAAVPGTLGLRPGWARRGWRWRSGARLAAGAQGIWQLLRLPPLASARRRPGRWRQRGAALAGFGGAGAAGAAGRAGAWGRGFGRVWRAGGAFAGGGADVAGTAGGGALAAGRAKGVISEWFWADARHQLPGLSLAMMALLLAWRQMWAWAPWSQASAAPSPAGWTSALRPSFT
jgi:putative ABC transport system permease protein